MKITWTVPALVDRRAIYNYIELNSSAAADAVDEAIIQGTRRLLTFPSLGHMGRLSGTRELTIHPNYIVVYRIHEQEVQIVRVLHTARQWP